MQAVLYFQRALNLDPNCLEAWTLIGHEYLEMKNPNAAIEAYRRAVDVNAKDFRAWYGLGQTYEMLVMPYYALFYYRKAAQLRPNDARMWVRVFLLPQSWTRCRLLCCCRALKTGVDKKNPACVGHSRSSGACCS